MIEMLLGSVVSFGESDRISSVKTKVLIETEKYLTKNQIPALPPKDPIFNFLGI